MIEPFTKAHKAKEDVRCAVVQALAAQVWHDNNPGDHGSMASGEYAEERFEETLIEFAKAYTESEVAA